MGTEMFSEFISANAKMTYLNKYKNNIVKLWIFNCLLAVELFKVLSFCT